MKTHLMRVQIRNAQFQPRQAYYTQVTEEYLVRNLGRDSKEWHKDAIQGAIRGKNILDNMRIATQEEIERDVYNKHPKASTKKGSKHFYNEIAGEDLPEEIKQYEESLKQRQSTSQKATSSKPTGTIKTTTTKKA